MSDNLTQPEVEEEYEEWDVENLGPKWYPISDEERDKLRDLTEELFNDLQEETRMLSHKGLALTINGIQIQITVTRDSYEFM